MKKRLFAAAALSLTFIFFQNFTSEDQESDYQVVPAEMLEQASTSNHNIWIPNSGHDLKSIGFSWATGEKDLLFKGRDKEILDSWNKKIQDLLSSENEEDVPAEGLTENNLQPSENKKKPIALKFSRANKIAYTFNSTTQASCEIRENGAQFEIQNNLGFSQLVLKHNSSNKSSSLNFQIAF